MGKSTEDLIKEISNVITEIRTPLLESGLGASAIAFKKKKMEEYKPGDLERAIIWLEGFRVYLSEYEKVKKLVPEAVWNMYRNLGQRKGIYELDERNRVVKILHKEWAKRPPCLNREPKKHDSEGRKKASGSGSKA